MEAQVSITTFSSREFSQDAGRAKRATARGPVFITDRGRLAHVLLKIEDYRRLRGEKKMSLLKALSQSGKGDDFEFEPSKLGQVTRPADLD